MAAPDLSGYVDVAQRLRVFLERYPDGSIQASAPAVIELDGKRFQQVTATVYRTPADTRPSVATAWEPWPGRTPYTLDSEAMNCETSAAGRALAFLGLEVHRSVATAEEVRNRTAPAAPTFTKARMTRLKDALARHAGTSIERQLLVELIVGHPAAALADLPYDELETLERALTELADGTARLELDEEGKQRIVTVEVKPNE